MKFREPIDGTNSTIKVEFIKVNRSLFMLQSSKVPVSPSFSFIRGRVQQVCHADGCMQRARLQNSSLKRPEHR